MIQLRLHPEMEAQLAAEAQERGLPLDRYIVGIVEARPSGRASQYGQRHKAVDAMMAFAAKHGVTLSGLQLTVILHEGHKY